MYLEKFEKFFLSAYFVRPILIVRNLPIHIHIYIVMVSTQNSRLIVRNLPATFTDVNLRSIFQKYGTITDASLRYTSTGAFRRFAYVGFEDDSSCELAISKTNNTFYNGLKLLVTH